MSPDHNSASVDASRKAGNPTNAGDIDLLCINTIRTLSMDAVQKANSGHPGTPMAMAPVAYTLWQHFLNFDPADPNWPNRDRFVLSVGHASMLLYSLIHLTGMRAVNEHENTSGPALTIDDLKKFRQMDSKTPGHPEYRITSGIETTTGPLGQGCGNSVGLAMAERFLANRYNKPGFELFNHHVYVLAGDGDMMEGVSAEAASTAAHLRLGNLTWIYDSNHITIEGGTDLAFDEDVAARFAAYGWDVQHVEDANDLDAMAHAIEHAKSVTDRPSFILVHSIIGYGAPKKAGTNKAHGEPLGDEEIRGAKRAYGWPEDSSFLVPDGVYDHFKQGIGRRGADLHAAWHALMDGYKVQHPDLAAELEMMNQHTLPDGWDSEIPSFPADAKGMASRDSSQKVLNAIAPHVPWMIGGAADLAPSTKSNMTFQGANSFEADNYGGRNLHFGIREHAMGSICNGLALSALRSYGSGFLIFSDYMKPPIRLSALMELPVVYIFTHDSIGVGEDGPTHQPIEQILSLRAIPGMLVLRPGDANEVSESWRHVMTLKEQPACLILSRQAMPTLDREKYASAAGVKHGAYILADPPQGGEPEVILMATGTEVSLAVGAYETLTAEGIRARVVSFPSWELFEDQPAEYRHSVLPPHIKGRVSVEQGSTIGWDRYVGDTGVAIGMHTFGASAPLAALLKKFGFTPDAVVAAARKQAGHA
jgi:transketolase